MLMKAKSNNPFQSIMIVALMAATMMLNVVPMSAKAQSNLPPIPQNMIVGVSIQDLHAAPMSIPLPRWKVAKTILPDLINQITGRQKVENIHPFYLVSYPTQTNDYAIYRLFTLIRYDRGWDDYTSPDGDNDNEGHRDVHAYLFDLYVYQNQNSGFISNVIDLNTSGFQLKAQVSLVDRKVILSDDRFQIKLVFPIGVGSFDLGVMNPGKNSLLTPRFKSAYLSAGATISKRHKPTYFNHKPFIRIVDGANHQNTEIGFHTDINEDFVRGFDSHGCMRVRDQDLYMLHDLVKYVQQMVPLTVSYRLPDTADHPAPKRDYAYNSVRNAGTAQRPEVALDKFDLTDLSYVQQRPPVELLRDEPNDHYKNLYVYDGVKTWLKQQEMHQRECEEQSKWARDRESAIENCMKPYKRDLSIGDWWDRWWTL